MKSVLMRIKVPEEVANGFDDFIKENKSAFGTKANLLRVMLANINLLATVNPNIIDKEKNKLKKENEQLRLKIIEREAEIFSLKNMQGSDKSLNVESLDRLNLLPQMMDKLNSIEMMIAPQYFSGNIKKEPDDSNSLDSIFKSPRLR